MHEAAHEADRGAADQQQEDEDVERGHRGGASELCSSLRATGDIRHSPAMPRHRPYC